MAVKSPPSRPRLSHAVGVYQPGDYMRNTVNNELVTAHIFEYTTTFGMDPNLRFVYPDKGVVSANEREKAETTGYHHSAKNITAPTRKIIHGTGTEIPELYILGNPLRPLSPSGQRRVLESMFEK